MTLTTLIIGISFQQQEFQLGEQLRSLYLENGSSTLVQGISTGLFDQTQVHVRADAGGERGVIFDSSMSVVQGLWPATTSYNTTLANGTTVIAPLGGYQYVPSTCRKLQRRIYALDTDFESKLSP